MSLQPLLHQLLVAVQAPTQVLAGPDGQIRGTGAQGVFHGDVRVLRRAVLTVAGAEPEVISARACGSELTSIALARTIDSEGADPTVRLVRTMTVSAGRVSERIRVYNATDAAVRAPLEMQLACDGAAIEAVKVGKPPRADLPRQLAAGTLLAPGTVHWCDGAASGDGGSVPDAATWAVRIEAAGAVITATDPHQPVASWDVTVPAHGEAVVQWDLVARDFVSPVLPAATAPPTWESPAQACADNRVRAWVSQALRELASLRMSAAAAPQDVFLAAGAPWFFTLFGRDSIWAARLLLPLDWGIAAGTLRTLAAYQGRVEDPDSAEQPGKIPHELRRAPLDLADGRTYLPPLYYGTVDATALWVCLLHDAWRAGMPLEEVRALAPALLAALGWLRDYGDADGDGFVEYIDTSGHGLANQGWKDSGDSIQYRDGHLAKGPIALVEVQGYAYEAAMAGATLLDELGLPGGSGWRQWAEALANRLRETFWLEDRIGPYLGIALDGHKQVVDVVASNMGHLPSTGILNQEEIALVAARLGHPELNSGYGLRTMATSSAGYWPLKYHGGSVWTHDTAIATVGLARTGHREVAGALGEGLLRAAADFGYSMPELYSGDAYGTVPAAVPYPAACHPQAWSAAAAIAVWDALYR